MKKKIYFLLYSKFRFNLYTSVARVYKNLGCEVTFFVQDIETINLLKKEGEFNFVIFKITPNKDLKLNKIPNVEKCIDVISGFYDEYSSRKLYSYYLEFIRHNIYSESFIFAGNGHHVQDLALLALKEELNLKVLFSELSNIDGKVFFDRCGSNFNSIYAKTYHFDSPALSSIEKEKLNIWREEYKKNKLASHVVKQAKKKNFVTDLKSMVFEINNFILNIPSLNTIRYGSLSKYLSACLKKNKQTKLDNVTANTEIEELKDSSFIFLPLQVTDDSQILINSEYDNYEAIKYFLNKAKQHKKKLCIKIHPAEKDQNFISKINDIIAAEPELLVSKSNTFELIMKSFSVGVINSTVGLEAILLEKEVEFIGRSFYPFLKDDKELYYYLFNYLVQIDFFTGQAHCKELTAKFDKMFLGHL